MWTRGVPIPRTPIQGPMAPDTSPGPSLYFGAISPGISSLPSLNGGTPIRLELRWSTQHKAPSQLAAHIQHCPRPHCACDYKTNSEVILSVQHWSLSMSHDGKLVAGHLFHCAKGHNAHANGRAAIWAGFSSQRVVSEFSADEVSAGGLPRISRSFAAVVCCGASSSARL